jgi:hypothetical protein
MKRTRSTYPLKYRIIDKLLPFGFFKKSNLLKCRGYYKTMSGDWRDSHGIFLSKEAVARMSIEELRCWL